MNSDDGSLGRNRRPPDPTALMQEVEWNMASKRTLTVVAGVGAAALAIAGVAIAQNHEANENRIIGKHSERDIPLAQVPEAAMNAARAQLASISKAEARSMKSRARTATERRSNCSSRPKARCSAANDGSARGAGRRGPCAPSEMILRNRRRKCGQGDGYCYAPLWPPCLIVRSAKPNPRRRRARRCS